ncbi:2OG-Fe(II) oxygenase, partial [Pseudomonas syringae pv. syringae FF5]
MDQLPVIDIAPLYGTDTQAWQDVARQIDSACRAWGFFYIKGHPISAQRIEQVQSAAKDFFARPAAEKLLIDITQSTHH